MGDLGDKLLDRSDSNDNHYVFPISGKLESSRTDFFSYSATKLMLSICPN